MNNFLIQKRKLKPLEIVKLSNNRIVVNKGCVINSGDLSKIDVDLTLAVWEKENILANKLDVVDGDGIYVKILHDPKSSVTVGNFANIFGAGIYINPVEPINTSQTTYLKIGDVTIVGGILKVKQELRDNIFFFSRGTDTSTSS